MLKLKLFGYAISLWLVVVIYLRIPEESRGLTSFANTTTILGSPSSARRFLNLLTFISIIIYLAIAINLNCITLII